MNSAIQTCGLTKRYGSTLALDCLDLEVPTGVVFGLLGPNGAGKTTTLRLLVGLLSPSAGHARVLGHHTVQDRREVHRRIGYLPGDFVAPKHLTGADYLGDLASLCGDVSWSSVELLAKHLDLDLDRRIGELSHGNRQKVGLVQAFMGEPELLILDEPTSGLDPLVQRSFLAMVREVRDAGRTVLLSSHVLSEVEAIADQVGILRQGRLVAVEDVEALQGRAVRRLDVTFAGPVPAKALTSVEGVRDVHAFDRTAQLQVEGSMEALWRVAASFGVADVVSHEADLEAVFLTYYEGEGQP